MTRTAIRTCHLCEATCGLRLTLEGEEVVRAEGDADDVFSHGYLCPKGAAIGQLEADPDRLHAPLVRRDASWAEVTWDEAFEEVADRLWPIIDEHGPDAVAVYLGNPNVHNLSGSLYGKPLVKALRTRNIYTASTVDQMPKHVSSGLLFGDPLTIAVPDLDRTDHLLMLGANPRMSNGSLCTAPDFPGRLDALRKRGGKVVVIDPRRSRTAARADEHQPIRPGTDALLLAAMATVAFEDGLVRLGRLAEHVRGLEEVRHSLAPFTPEVVADRCGIPADTIRRLARELAEADRAVVYGRMGTTTVRFGTVASWLVDVLNLLTGNLDEPGGAMFPTPAHVPDRSGRPPFEIGRWTSRVRGLPEVSGELPVATLADEILTPGDGKVRAFISIAGNPVLSTPSGDRLSGALAQLDFMLSVDPYLNETTRHADVILPPPPALRRSHYDAAFYNLSIRNVANYSPAVLEPEPDRPDEWEIFLRLGAAATGQGAHADISAFDDLVATTLAHQLTSYPGSPVNGRDPDELLGAVAHRRGPERLLDLLLRSGPHGDHFNGNGNGGLTLDVLIDKPHGVDLGPLESRIPDVLNTRSGMIELLPRPIEADLARLAASLDEEAPALVLVGRRHLRTNNSWMHNVPMLAKGSDLCTLQIHPTDAKRCGVDGQMSARVASAVGSIVVPVEITEDITQGVVSVPHGFGHDLEGVELNVAAEKPGANTNRLSDPESLDAVSGNAVLNGIPVTVEPAT